MKKAREYYEMNVPRGCVDSSFALGTIYYEGLLGFVDNKRAFELFLLFLGHDECEYEDYLSYAYNFLNTKDYLKYRELLELYDRKGIAFSKGIVTLSLGEIYYFGFGVPKDIQRAQQHFKISLNDNKTSSQAKLYLSQIDTTK